MDYKELIERLLRLDCVYANGCVLQAAVAKEDAAAIETLLTERDAAVAGIPHNCKTCRWWKERVIGVWYCMAPEDSGLCYRGDWDVWQWRGPQKADYTYLK